MTRTVKEVISQSYKTLYDWQHICFRSANFIASHFFIQEQIKSLFYLTDDIKLKLADIAKDEAGILNTSRMNSFYRMLSDKFKGRIPTSILSALNSSLFGTLNKESSAYWKGEKSLRNYRKDIPIPIQARDIRHVQLADDGRNFRFNICALPFKTYFGKDIFDKRGMFENAQNGIIKLCTSAIQIKNNKIFLLATFQWSKAKEELDDTVIAEASLSLEYPIVVVVGTQKYQIGNKEEFLYRRLAIQAARHRMQKAVAYNIRWKRKAKKIKTC